MKLIDADTLLIKVQELIKEYERRMPEYAEAALKWGYKADGVEDVLKLIIDAPIIKAETIKHGRWIKMGYEDYECSNCKAALWARKVNPVGKYKYCWSCGAKMGGDVNDA